MRRAGVLAFCIFLVYLACLGRLLCSSWLLFLLFLSPFARGLKQSTGDEG